MKKRWLLSFLFLITVSACLPKDQTPDIDPDINEAPESGDFHLTLKECPVDLEEDIPIPVSPMGDVLDPSPPHVYTWEMECIPEMIWIKLYKVGEDSRVWLYDDVDANKQNYAGQFQLEPLTDYTWVIAARMIKGTHVDGYGGHFSTGKLSVEFTALEFKALKNANCRKDPWAGENYVSVIWEGDTAEILGLSEDATWGMFKLKNELECWVNMALVQPDPPEKLYFPQMYPVLEHGEPPDDIPAPASDDEPSGGGTAVGCMAPSGRSGTLTCQIPCPDPNYAARVCP